MWTCAPAYNPAQAQPGMLAGSLADMREKAHAATPALPHEDIRAASRAVMLTSLVAATRAMRTIPHFCTPPALTRRHASMSACAHRKLSHNPTSQQESMRT
jgi:hypothetical protein